MTDWTTLKKLAEGAEAGNAEATRKLLKAIMTVIEEGAIGRGPIDGPMVQYTSTGELLAVPWDDRAVRRLFDVIEQVAREHLASSEKYEPLRVKELESWLSAEYRKNEALLAENQRYREALEFYADQANYILHTPEIHHHGPLGLTIVTARGPIPEDGGKRAREALRAVFGDQR